MPNAPMTPNAPTPAAPGGVPNDIDLSAAVAEIAADRNEPCGGLRPFTYHSVMNAIEMAIEVTWKQRKQRAESVVVDYADILERATAKAIAASLRESPNASVGPAPAEDVYAALDAADAEVDALCQTPRKWTMSIPARPNEDSDLVIGKALHLARKALNTRDARIADLERARDIANEEVRALREECWPLECLQMVAEALGTTLDKTAPMFLDDHVRRLRAERDTLRAECEGVQFAYANVKTAHVEDSTRLRTELANLRRDENMRLRRWGQHDNDCALVTIQEGKTRGHCNCGLDSALNTALGAAIAPDHAAEGKDA